MKTTGIDDLIRTLIHQHGLERAIDAARVQARTIKDTHRAVLWSATLQRLKDMRT